MSAAIPSAALEACRAAVGIDELTCKLGAIWNRANRLQQQTIANLSGLPFSQYAGAPWHEIPCHYRSDMLRALVDLRDRLDKLLPPEQFPVEALH
jgi:hypothetical protein